MESGFICKYCQANYEEGLDKCKSCGFPLAGSEKEKAVFIGKQISNREKEENLENKLLYVKLTLWLIGFYNIFILFNESLKGITENNEFIISLITGIVFLVLGFFVYKNPLFCILFSLSILLLDYFFHLGIDRASNYYFVFRFLFIFYLIRALIVTVKIRRQQW